MPHYRYSTPLLASLIVSLSFAALLLVSLLAHSFALDSLDNVRAPLRPYIESARQHWSGVVPSGGMDSLQDALSTGGGGGGGGGGEASFPDIDTAPLTALPVCHRTLFIRFGSGTRGFGSHFSHLLRANAVAQHYDYELFVDYPSSSAKPWMYGRLDHYFSPPNRTCTSVGTPTWSSRVELAGSPAEGDRLAWLAQNHVREPSTGAVDYVDALFVALFTSSAFDDLHQEELEAYPHALPLDGLATVPSLTQPTFDLLESQVRSWWTLNEEVRTMVRLSKLDLEREIWEKGRQRPVIGVHVRLGDKCGELNNPSYSVLRFATRDDLQRLRGPTSSRCAPHADRPMDESTLRLYASAIEQQARSLARQWRTKSKPLVLVMSDDVSVVAQLADVVEDAEVRSIDEFGRVSGDNPLLTTGFVSSKFSELPFEQRIASTKTFVRDLSVLSELSDSLVFTGTSNVGRLLAVLAGGEKAKTGRYASVDVRWFPTARYY